MMSEDNSEKSGEVQKTSSKKRLEWGSEISGKEISEELFRAILLAAAKEFKWELYILSIALKFIAARDSVKEVLKKTCDAPDILLFLMGFTIKPEEREAVLGDIEERYYLWVERRGKWKAKSWLFFDVVRSFGPFLRELGRSKIMKLLKYLGIAEMVHRFWGGS